MQDIKIFACNSAKGFAEEVCNHLGLKLGEMDSFKFKNVMWGENLCHIRL